VWGDGRMFTKPVSMLRGGGGGGGGVKTLLEAMVNSKEEKDFCPNYVQEFGLCCHIPTPVPLSHIEKLLIKGLSNEITL
jgi:hypothetical protein